MSVRLDKRRQAHSEEINTSNGALFLRILELERQVKYLMGRVDDLTVKSRDIPFPIGEAQEPEPQ